MFFNKRIIRVILKIRAIRVPLCLLLGSKKVLYRELERMFASEREKADDANIINKENCSASPTGWAVHDVVIIPFNSSDTLFDSASTCTTHNIYYNSY